MCACVRVCESQCGARRPSTSRPRQSENRAVTLSQPQKVNRPMPLLSKIESAIALGISVELLDSFVQKCPKPQSTQTLPKKTIDGHDYFDEEDLHKYRRFLAEPWPKPATGKRPHIPEAIKEDIRQESHHQCAICGLMNGGEIAHIDAVAHTLNNSPDNLILLCPNHHTQFDYGGFTVLTPQNNVSREVILSAKRLKRNSRARMMRMEAGVGKVCLSLIKALSEIEAKLKVADPASLNVSVYMTEAKNLMGAISQLSRQAQEAGKSDRSPDSLDRLLEKSAPMIGKHAAGNFTTATDARVRSAIVSVVDAAQDALVEIDEVDCPHCDGRGVTGLNTDFCAYCRGSQQITAARAEAYDPDDIDEVDCPHCDGRGTTGLNTDYCVFCHGSQKVTSARAESYDPEDIDAVPCPHCNGRGITGLNSDYCAYCHGSQTVTAERARAYDSDDVDEVQCPHCEGRGVTGLNTDCCAYCRGSQVVTAARAEAYDPEDIDEVDCPHCDGRGTTGLNTDYCAYCRGSQKVTSLRAESYDRDSIDEVECPHCRGHGTTGLNGTVCVLCGGSQVVTSAKARAYHKKYPSRHGRDE